MEVSAPFTVSPEEVGLDPSGVQTLLDTAEGFVTGGQIPSAQIALARNGRLVAFRSFGRAKLDGVEKDVDNQTLYAGFSTTKAILASAAWLLIEEGKLDPTEPVAPLVPGFDTNNKQTVRFEHLLTHTAGFPEAPFDPLDWIDPAKREARFAKWRLDWEPGSQFRYHAAASLWVVAAVIEAKTGQPYQTFIRERIVKPLGLNDFYVGLPSELNRRVAEVVHTGDAPSAQELAESGIQLPANLTVDDAYLLRFNRSDFRAIGAPGWGGVFTAESLNWFYQALLDDAINGKGRVWKKSTLDDVLRVRTGELTDPITGRQANRALGMVIAGDDERMFRSFSPGNSERAFGHPGMGGQIAWADPETGLSLTFLTNGLDRDPMRMGQRGVFLSMLATECVKE